MLQRTLNKARADYKELEVEVVGMVADPNDPEGMTAAEGVDLDPTHWDAHVVLRQHRDPKRSGYLDTIELAEDATYAKAYRAAQRAARLLGLTDHDIIVR